MLASDFTTKDIERFWSKVDKSGEFDTCWLWMGSCRRSGYGQFRMRHLYLRAHRVSYIITNGEISNNLFVLHKCDVPNCVNPNHLFLGTNSDNLHDMAEKKRSTFGERNPHHILTEDDVRSIRKLYTLGHKQAELMRMFSVGHSCIFGIINYKSWKHIG